MNPDFSDMLSALSAEGVEFLLVGAYAMAVYGVAFDDAWRRRISTDLAGLTIPVIGREDLIRNKRATGRSRDLADADRLENSD